MGGKGKASRLVGRVKIQTRRTRVIRVEPDAVQRPGQACRCGERTYRPSTVTIVIRQMSGNFCFEAVLQAKVSVATKTDCYYHTLWINPINIFRVHPSLPTNLKSSVTHPLLTFSPNPNVSTAVSTVSSAIARYVVHFPPAIVNNPLLLTWII